MRIIKSVSKFIVYLLIGVILFLGILLYRVSIWVPDNFGNITFEQVLFHLFVPLEGTDSSYITSFIVYCLPIPTIVLLSFYILVVVMLKLKYAGFNFAKYLARVLTIVSIVCSCIAFVFGADSCMKNINADEYINGMIHPSELYERYYVDPSDVEYTFPEQKRNLIYIVLESMETTYEDTSNGGMMDVNLIPELTHLAKQNLTFSNGNTSLNGYYAMNGACWTASSLVAQTSGVPLNVPIDGERFVSEGNFLSGAYSIGEVLEKEGYKNTFFIGSDAGFGGREYYFKQHGNYEILDYDAAKEQGWIPEDYNVWWGYEDAKLFEFAKNELTELSMSDQPFNFTMLTADTHPDNGYLCEYCENLHDDQYSNVISCSSKQVAAFVSWIQQQPFYENTTIVLVGDHNSMQPDWFDEIDATGYPRKEYYCIINPAIKPEKDTPRTLSTFDFYPTTLASLGVSFNSDRLGLGTNMFSNAESLIESFGFTEFNQELIKQSDYYDSNILRKVV